MSIIVKYEVEPQPIKNLWDAVQTAESPSIEHKDADDFKAYLNMLVEQAFKAGINFQKNLKKDIDYGI